MDDDLTPLEKARRRKGALWFLMGMGPVSGYAVPYDYYDNEFHEPRVFVCMYSYRICSLGTFILLFTTPTHKYQLLGTSIHYTNLLRSKSTFLILIALNTTWVLLTVGLGKYFYSHSKALGGADMQDVFDRTGIMSKTSTNSALSNNSNCNQPIWSSTFTAASTRQQEAELFCVFDQEAW